MALIAHHHAQAAFEIAIEHSFPLGPFHFTLGESYMLLKDWNQAIAHYTSACDLRREEIDIGNVRYHLGEAYYCSGNKELGKELLLQGLAEIRTKSPEPVPFLSRVWESGCLMRLYDLEYSYAPMSELNEYIDKAQEIIDADPRLILRKKQLRQLLETKPKLG